MKRRRMIVLAIVSFFSGIAFVYSCGGGGSDNTPSYQVYGGRYWDSDDIHYPVSNPWPSEWSSKIFVGEADSTAEFDLGSDDGTEIRDIQIVANSEIFIDAIENLHTGEFAGGGTNTNGSNVTNYENVFGPADSVGGLFIGKDSFIITQVGGWSGRIVDRPGNDIKVYVGTHTIDELPYSGTGAPITEDDKSQIRQIISDFEIGYETKNPDLILPHIKDPIFDQSVDAPISKDTFAARLSSIFSCYDTITIDLYDYYITGNLPYAFPNSENLVNAYHVTATYPSSSDYIQSMCDGLSFFPEKIGNEWKIYFISEGCNWHGALYGGLR